MFEFLNENRWVTYWLLLGVMAWYLSRLDARARQNGRANDSKTFSEQEKETARKNMRRLRKHREKARALRENARLRKTTLDLDQIKAHLEALAQAGLPLDPNYSPEQLAEHIAVTWSPDGSMEGILRSLGQQSKESPVGPFCQRLCVIGLLERPLLESFYEPGYNDEDYYANVARRLADISCGTIVIEDAIDGYDECANDAGLRFKLDGKEVELNFVYEHGLPDPGVFQYFAEVLERKDPTKVYWSLESWPGFIIGCVKKDEYERLKELNPEIELLKDGW